MKILLTLLSIIFFSLLLVKATDISVLSLKNLSRKTRLGQFALSSLLMGLLTSLPELLVGITAAISDAPLLSLGNVIGSNIVNLSLVIGGAALLGGNLRVGGEVLKRDAVLAFLAGGAPLLLLWNGSLSRIDGLILLAVYGFYILTVIKDSKDAVGDENEGSLTFLLRELNPQKQGRDLVKIFGAVVLLLFAAEMIVRLSTSFSAAAGVPLFLTGLFGVAVGTSLPELVFGVKAARKKRFTMVWGNLLGSVVANGTLIIGVTALISPFGINNFPRFGLASLTYITVFALFYLFVSTKRRLERWEGAFLILVYLLFAASELAF